MEKSDLTLDVLKEIFNIGVGKAADMLSQIMQKKITLRVPKIFLTGDGPQKIDRQLAGLLEGTLMVSAIAFSESLKGRANLVFPAEKTHDFIRLCTGEEFSPSLGQSAFTDIDFDIMKEVGNIVLNSIIGEISNFLDISLSYSLPEVQVYNGPIGFRGDIESEKYKSVLILSVTFSVDGAEIEGAIFIDLTATSFQELFHLIGGIEEKFVG